MRGAGRFCGWEMPTFLIIIILYRHNGYVQDGLEKSCTGQRKHREY